MAKEDYYELLGVSKDTSADEIKKAYRKMAMKYHPDKNAGDVEAEEMFKKISEAYEVLKDSEKRAAYDRYGHAAFQSAGAGRGPGSGGFHDPFDLFKEVFGGSGGGIFEEFFGGSRGGSHGGSRSGADLRYDLEIELSEAAKGVEKQISFRRAATCERCDGDGAEPGSQKTTCTMCGGQGQVTSQRGFFSVRQLCPTCEGNGVVIQNPCGKCRGEGRMTKTSKINVRIPAGADTGTRLRSRGNGEAGLAGGESGDLYIIIHVVEHEIFERIGDDLLCEIPIKFTLASLGGTIDVPTLNGKASLKIPNGTQSGTTFRLRGHGVPGLHDRRSGDQLIRVQIEVPTRLNKDERKKLEDFAIACGDADHPVSDSFFRKAKRFFE
ncbi:MAG: Chaperone protein DnaJ [Candidatus Moanabacter tarae]|uniref:Chaperone protein DnaJ n=1 Tax=Candidatus Moanibacter tarae TaxID=2200854 RepID=A0A2Z4AHN0_9BACT|nr:MAG: Chaperone protein DnaJ [Candidatus Moanabacter tarae]